MQSFILSSAIAMAALLAVYYLLLQREKMYRFNRFYLLGALVFSIAVPFISIPIYVEVIATPIEAPLLTMPIAAEPQPAAPETDYLPYIIGGLYGAVTLMLTFRFCKNLWHFRKTVKQNQVLPHESAMLVLVEEAIVPHTFLSYIFINKEAYKSRRIAPELFAHELAHVTQKHTLDILLIESLKTVFWFNPLLYLYKHALQLNHEFLADESVLKQSNNVITYQQLLLLHATPRTTFALASSLNFSITKKRFAMMTKTTQKNKALLLKLAALPVLAGLVYALSTKTIAQTKTTHLSVQGTATDSLNLQQRRDAYFSGVRVLINDHANGVLIDIPYENLTAAQKDAYMPDAPAPIATVQPTQKQFEAYKDSKTYAIWIDGKNVPNTALNKYSPQDFAHHQGSLVHKNARSTKYPQPYQFQFYTPEYFKTHMNREHFSGDTFKLDIAKEYKDGEVLAPNERRTASNDAGAILKQMAQDDVYSYEQTDIKPEYPGGINAFRAIIAKNFSATGLPNGDVKVMVSFIIEKDGSMSSAKVLKETDAQAGKEAVRALSLAEKWKPGQVKGAAVRTSYTLPITVRVNNEPEVKE